MRPLIVPFFIAHQGCPHQCVFCNQIKIAGGNGTVPSAAEMREKIAAYRASGHRDFVEVAFFGGTFTALPLSAMEGLLLPLQPLLARGEVSSIRISTRPDSIDAPIADFLRRMGVGTVELGVQSMDDEVLGLAGRGHTSRDVENACRILQATGHAVGVQLMPGLPGDTPAKALASFHRVLTLNPGFLRIYPALVIDGTRLAELYGEGRYLPLSLGEAVRLCKIMLHVALVASVPVIRIGLQPTEELQQAGTVVAGPYHSAFRQLAEGELYYDLLCQLIRGVPPGATVTISCAPAMVSTVAGQRRANIVRLFQNHGVEVAALKGEPELSRREVQVTVGNSIRKGNVLRDLHYAPEVTAGVR